jgi:hypothetical protein
MGARNASTRITLTGAGVLAVALAAVLASCTLDFDHFDPVGADGSAPRADVGPEDAAFADEPQPSAGDDALAEAATPDTGETGPTDGDAQAGDADAAEAADAADACTPSSSCLTTAGTCAMTCAQQEQQCASRCGGSNCRSTCTRTETTCTTQCSATCASCTQSAGCRSTANPTRPASAPA